MQEQSIPKSTKIRFDELDLFRLIAAVCVVIIHLTASAIGRFEPGSSLQLIATSINALALYAVPAFIGISALTIHLSSKDKPLNLGQFFKRRVAVLALPYLVWTTLYYLDQLHFSGQSFSITAFGSHLLLGTAFYHLYFMTIIFQFYLLYPICHRLLKRIQAPWLFIISIILFLLYTGDLSHWLHLDSWVFWPLKGSIPYSDRFFMSYLPFYTLGLWLAETYANISNSKWRWLAIALPLYGISEFAHLTGRVSYFVYQKNGPLNMPLAWEISSLCAIVILIFVTQSIRQWFGVPLWVKRLSGYTFTLYLAHPLILQICEIKLSGLAARSMSLYFLVTALLCLSLPLIGSEIYRQFQQKINGRV